MRARYAAGSSLYVGRSRGEIRDRAVEHERDRALRVGRGEQHRHRAALGDAEDDRPLRSDGVHHRAHVVHARLEVGKPVLRHPIGEADAALVEQDQPRERREAFEEPGEAGGVPHRLDVRDPPHHEDHVDGSVAHHLIGDVDPVGRLRVAGLRAGHVRILPLAGRSGNRRATGPRSGARRWSDVGAGGLHQSLQGQGGQARRSEAALRRGRTGLREGKPQTAAWLIYLDEGGSRVSFVHCFPDARSMDLHFEGSDERSAAVYEFVEPDGFEIYGSPSDEALETMRQAAEGSGVSFNVRPEHLGGFLRAQSS